MTFKPNHMVASRYQLISKVGRGGYSEVWLASDLFMDKMEVALKIFAPEKGLDESGLNLFKKEYAMMMGLNHPGLLKATYFDVYMDSPFLVMPFCREGSLGSKLRNDTVFDETEIAKIIVDLAPTMDYLHKNGIVHQDVKPDNILIHNDGRYLLSDFGISGKMRHTLQTSNRLNSASLTLAYAAPERFSNATVQLPASDIFSFGVMIYEICTGIVPWNGAGGSIVQDESLIPYLPDPYAVELSKILRACLSYDPKNRPTPEFLLSSALHFQKENIWQAPEPASLKPKKRITQKIEFFQEQETDVFNVRFPQTDKVEVGQKSKKWRFPITRRSKIIASSLMLSLIFSAFFWWFLFWNKTENSKEVLAETSLIESSTSKSTEEVQEELNDQIESTESTILSNSNPTKENLSNTSSAEIVSKPAPRKAEIRTLRNIIVANQVGDYYGEILNGKPHGKGQISWKNGNGFDGFFESGFLFGTGTLTYANGDRFVGSFVKDLPNGQGILTLKNGYIPNCMNAVKYNGSWKNGVKDGIGTCLDIQGEIVFQGSFSNDQIVR